MGWYGRGFGTRRNPARAPFGSLENAGDKPRLRAQMGFPGNDPPIIGCVGPKRQRIRRLHAQRAAFPNTAVPDISLPGGQFFRCRGNDDTKRGRSDFAGRRARLDQPAKARSECIDAYGIRQPFDTQVDRLKTGRSRLNLIRQQAGSNGAGHQIDSGPAADPCPLFQKASPHFIGLLRPLNLQYHWRAELIADISRLAVSIPARTRIKSVRGEGFVSCVCDVRRAWACRT